MCVAYGQAFRHHSYALEDLIRRVAASITRVTHVGNPAPFVS